MANKVKDNYLDLGNQKYFRVNAHIIRIGSYGKKKDPLGAKASIDPHNKIKVEHLTEHIQLGSTQVVDWSQGFQAGASVEAPVKYFGVNGKVGVAANAEKAAGAHLKLVNFYMMPAALQRVLNNEASGAKKFLAEEGDGRVVSEIWVAMEAELANSFNVSGSISAQAKAAGQEVEVTLSAGKYGSQTLVLSPGTTFAYKLHKVTKWIDNKTKIDTIEADYYGMS